MSLPGPTTPSTGDQVPVSRFIASIADGYPRVDRNRLIESSIAGREKVEVLPINLNSYGLINGGFLEFRIPGIPNRFIDTSKINLELKLTVRKGDETDMGDLDNVDLPLSVINSIFRSCQVYIGEKLVESNPYFNYSAAMKLLKTFKYTSINTLGQLANINNSYESESETYVTASFPGSSTSTVKRINEFKTVGYRGIFPLFLDIASLDQYLLDGVPLRIRLEVASNEWALNSDKINGDYRLQIEEAKMWIEKVIPHSNSLVALNQNLSKPGKCIEYLFNRTLFKNISLPANQTSVTIDMPWNSIIPNTLSFIILNSTSFTGNYNKNGLYFQNADVTEIRATINGAPVYTVTSKFPHFTNQAYYESLNAIGLNYNPLLTHKAFVYGKTMFCIKFDTDESDDTITVEKSGNLRISISFGTPSLQNRVILMNGDTTGIIKIDSDRNVLCDVRA